MGHKVSSHLHTPQDPTATYDHAIPKKTLNMMLSAMKNVTQSRMWHVDHGVLKIVAYTLQEIVEEKMSELRHQTQI